MKRFFTTLAVSIATLLMFLCVNEAQAQFRGFWLDIGTYHNVYSEGGAKQEAAPGIPEGMDWPAILRSSGHGWARAFWVGTKDWTNETGQSFPHYVSRIGPREPGIEFTTPIETRIVSKYADTEVFVDGALAFDKLAVINAADVDPTLAADRMIVNRHNMDVGISVTRKIYAYVNQFHDNYHIIEHEYCNTGNINGDEAIELDGQNLTDVYFFHMHRWRQSGQAAWQFSSGQAWGKFNMIDVVGDGHEEYPVDFSAFYAWMGFDPAGTEFISLGSPLYNPNNWSAPFDTVGRFTGGSFTGRAFLHADQSTSDNTFVQCSASTFDTCQPKTIGWMDQDEPLAGVNESHQNYYELGILTRESDPAVPGSSRNYPHYADRVEPSGEFWNPTTDASSGGGSVAQGGYAPFEAYGPYDIGFGECINTTAVEGVAGLSYDASVQLGRAFNNGGRDDAVTLSYDANNDGTISSSAFDYSSIGLPVYQNDGCTTCATKGSEELTKNQWVMTARDSVFQMIFRARDLYEASNGMTQYPIPEAPLAPVEFTVDGLPNGIELAWQAHPGGGPAVDHWEVYRTSSDTDNLLDADGNGVYEFVSKPWGLEQVVGYEKIADVPAGQNTFSDQSANRGTNYYYYVIAVGQAQADDPKAISGTPGGAALTSSRSLTQSYLPATLKRPAYGATGTVQDARIVPNPVNLGSREGVRFNEEDRVAFFNIPPLCTIKIFTEIGELVHTIEHTDGTGDETWNLTTSSRQLLVSGIYIAVIEDQEQGGRSTVKFTVIR